MTILFFIVIGLVVGLGSGMLGIGGGVVLVPLLMMCFPDRFSQPQAAGTTLAVLVPGCLAAAWKYHSQDLLDTQAVMWIAISFVIGSWLGATLAPMAPRQLLSLMLGVALIYIGARYVIITDIDAVRAATGILLVGLSWLLFFGLRALGRKYRPKSLPAQIRELHEKGKSGPEPDYYI